MYTRSLMSFNSEVSDYTGSAFFSCSLSGAEIPSSEMYREAYCDRGEFETDKVGKYSIYEIADWFLCRSNMTHKKLQKLCYYAQAWCYALRGYRLIDSDFEAWTNGPISPALWEKFFSFGYSSIMYKGKRAFSFSPEDCALLEDIWETYGGYTGNALEILSQRETPWIEARKGYAEDEKCSVSISASSMARYYKSIYAGD